MKTLHLLTTTVMVTLGSASMALAAPSAADFAKKATVSGTFEVESSELALDKSDNEQIRDFAQQMIDDHTKAQQKLNATAKDIDLDPALTEEKLDAKHQKIVDALEAKQDGAAFDRAYIKAQRDAHKEAVSLFSGYAKSGKDKDMKAFASETLPTLKMHKKHIDQFAAK